MMKYKIKTGLCFLFLFRALFLLAQEEPVAQPDSVVNSESSLQKTGKIAGVAIPSLMVTYGVLSFESKALKDFDNDVRTGLNDKLNLKHIDDFAWFTPAALAFGLNLSGNKGKHEFWDMAALYTLSNVVNVGIVYGLKTGTSRERPDASDRKSFPSMHTSTAFVAAEFLRMEYGDKSVWYGVGGYTIATMTGVARIVNNKHWFSDVIAGAGVGVLSAKFAYYVYPYLKTAFIKKESQKQQAVIFPGYTDGSVSLNVFWTF